MARNTTRISMVISRMMLIPERFPELENASEEARISSISCGITIGKPRIAIIAAFCCALAAIAARNVKTRLRPQPPSNTNMKKDTVLNVGFPKKTKKSKRLNVLIKSINKELKSSFASMKFCGLAKD